MRPWFALVSLLAACGPSRADYDELERRVQSLERRLRTVEGGSAAKPRRDRAPLTGEAMVTVQGDALTVALGLDEGPVHPLPGTVPAGRYYVYGTFAEGEQPTVVGKATVRGGEEVELSCVAADRLCSTASQRTRR